MYSVRSRTEDTYYLFLMWLRGLMNPTSHAHNGKNRFPGGELIQDLIMHKYRVKFIFIIRRNLPPPPTPPVPSHIVNCKQYAVKLLFVFIFLFFFLL